LGTPIFGAEVQMKVSGSEAIEKVSTNSDGLYFFKTVPNGKFIVSVRCGGFAESKVESSYYVEGGQGLRSIDFGLEVGNLGDFIAANVTGIVSIGGKPITDQKITIVNPFNYNVTQDGISDGYGRFNISVREPGQYIVYVTRSKSPVCAKGLLVEPGIRDKNLNLNLVCD
jgi:hypothetical protein